jgi:hypothetical protein
MSYRLWNFAAVKRMWREEPRLSRWRGFFENQLYMHIEKCDFSRYAILYLYGGVYADLDVTCHRRFDDVFLSRPFTWCLDVSELDYWNGLLASCAGHPIWPHLMDCIMFSYPSNPKRDAIAYTTTGPTMLGHFARKLGIDYLRRPDLVMDNCLFYQPNAARKKISVHDGTPMSWKEISDPRTHGKCVEKPCAGIEPYTTADHTQGSGWQADQTAFKYKLTRVQIIEPNAVLFLLLLMFVLVVLFAAYFFRQRDKWQEACPVPYDEEPNKISVPFRDSIVMSDGVF